MELPKKLAFGGAGLFIFGIIFGWVAFPAIVKSQIKKEIALKEGAEIRGLWAKFPFPLDFMVYLFNVTNPVEISQGQKPVLQEIGPYFYDEYKEKVDLVDREEDDSVEYSKKTTWYFNPSKSNGLTGEEELMFPHILILGIVKATLIEKPTAMGIVGKAVDSIFHKPNSVFVRAKAKDIIFGGLPIDCTVRDFAGSAICSVLKQQAKDLVEVEENRYTFSLFGSKNGTILPERVRVLRGIKNYKDVGKVIEYDGKPALTTWPEDHCNAFNGTDATIFSPLISEDDDIVSFAADICRSVSAHFHHKSKVKGVNTFHYTADLGDMSKNPLEKCFCPTPDTCLTKNLYDMTKCLGAPIIGSLPHFLGSEERYIHGVEGMNPDESLHDISMDFEPMTGTPINAHQRLQFNMMLHSVEKFKLMKTFPEVLFPLFWVEEGILLDDQIVNKVKLVFKIMAAVGFMKWLMVLGGVGMLGASAGMHFMRKNNSNKLEITKVTPETANSKEGDKKWPPAMNISTIQSAAVPPNLD